MKAKLFDDDVTHRKILRCNSPYQAKKLSYNIRKFDKTHWEREAEGIAYRCVKCKFAQNPMLRNILLNTGNLAIAEASGDEFWGTGVPLKNPNAIHSDNWKNSGLMKKIYDRVREDLRHPAP